MKKMSYIVGIILMISITTVFSEPLEQLITNVVNFKIFVDDEEVNLKNHIVTINDSTYIPLRDVAEIFGHNVEWDEKTKTISMDSYKNEYELFPFKKGSLYGYIDIYGKVIIEPQFEYAGVFSEGLACVGKSKGRDWGVSGISEMAYGYINTSGKLVIPYINERKRDFHSGFACAWKLDSDRICYFMNKNGENAFSKTYYDIKDFSDNYAAVLLNNTAKNPHRTPTDETPQWTFIDVNGKECGEIYNSVTSFVDGRSIVEKDGVQMVINTSCETVFQSDYLLLSYNDGRYVAKDVKSGKYGVIDDKNNIIIDFKYNYIHYSDGMYKVELDHNAYGIINKYGDIILEPKMNQFVHDYKSGMSVIGNNNSVIDKNGNITFTANEYDVAVPCADNLIYVFKKEHEKEYEGYIDKYGNLLIWNEVDK